MNSNNIFSHTLHIRHRISLKMGNGHLSEQNFTKAFFLVWRLKAVEFIKQLIKMRFSCVNPFTFKKFLFIFVTHNQYLAVAPIFGKLKQEATGIKHEFNVNQNVDESVNIPFLYIYFLDFISFPIFFFLHRRFLVSKYGTHIKDITLLNIASFTLSIYWLFNFLFWFKKPDYLVMSNDHSDINVGVYHSAKRNRIKTIYFQHANVSEIFPPMTFDFAFLYSEMAAEVYWKIEHTDTTMICVGNMKSDEFMRINQRRVFDRDNLRIVLCVNTRAELDDYVALAEDIAGLDNVRLIKFRLHPYLLKIKLDFDDPKIVISNSKIENSFDCFKDMDLNIAGNSSIIEEALFTDTPTIYFDIDERMSDYYGYEKNRIVIASLKNANQIIRFLMNYQSPVSVISKASLYSSSINTKYSGKTSDLVFKIFADIDSGIFPNLSVLKKSEIAVSANIYSILKENEYQRNSR